MLHFWDKIREFRAIAHEYEGSQEGGYTHIENGVGLGYIKVDQNEKVADDKTLQSSLLTDLVEGVAKIYNELKRAYEKKNG